MAFLIDQLNNSGLFAQSAYSAGIATCDSDGNIITATYLSSHQPISADEWNSSYETVQSNSGTWNTKQDSLDFKYDSINNNISSINDSALNASTFSYGAIGRDPRNAYSAVNYIQLGSGNDGGIFMGHSTFGTAYYKTNEFVLNRGTTGQIKFNVGGGGPALIVSGRLKSDLVLAAPNQGVSSIYGSSSINISANGNLYEINPSSINAWNSNYDTVFNNSAYWSDANITVQNNSASWNNVTNKLDTTAFSDVSGTFLTAHQPISADEWNDVYNTVNVNSGSWTGSESSPTASVDSNGSIDIVSSNNTVYFDVNGTWFNNAVNSAVDVPTGVMVESACEYNAVNEISGYNGSAIAQYGAEKQWLQHDDTIVHVANSAQYAFGCNVSALQRLMGIDETVLFEGMMSGTLPVTASLSDTPSAYKTLKFIAEPGIYFTCDGSTTRTRHLYGAVAQGIIYNYAVSYAIDNANKTISLDTGRAVAYRIGGNSISNYENCTSTKYSELRLVKVIGIGRKQ